MVNVRMPVEEARVRSLAHGMKPQQKVAQHFTGIKTGSVIVVIGFPDRIIQVGKDGVVGWLHLREVCVVGNIPLFI